MGMREEGMVGARARPRGGVFNSRISDICVELASRSEVLTGHDAGDPRRWRRTRHEEWLNDADSIDVSIAIEAIKQHYVMDTSEVWFALETTRSSSSHSR